MQVGQTILAGQKVPVKSGDSMPLINMPEGTVVHNIEL